MGRSLALATNYNDYLIVLEVSLGTSRCNTVPHLSLALHLQEHDVVTTKCGIKLSTQQL